MRRPTADQLHVGVDDDTCARIEARHPHADRIGHEAFARGEVKLGTRLRDHVARRRADERNRCGCGEQRKPSRKPDSFLRYRLSVPAVSGCKTGWHVAYYGHERESGA
jgi:hypothetical protein